MAGYDELLVDKFTAIHAVPNVQIERRGFRYEVTVLTERHGATGGFGVTGWAWTKRGAQRLVRRFLGGTDG